jgi:hypothetical protein
MIQCWAGWGVQVHPLSSPLVLGPDNAGLVLTAYTADMAAGMPRPIVSGGVRVGPFAPDPARHGVLKADAPTSATRPSVMFAEGGGWLHRARLPRRGNGPQSAYVTLHATNGPLTATLPAVACTAWPTASHCWPSAGQLHSPTAVQAAYDNCFDAACSQQSAHPLPHPHALHPPPLQLQSVLRRRIDVPLGETS